jgi:GNAT superfamily N-acetyltransferase
LPHRRIAALPISDDPRLPRPVFGYTPLMRATPSVSVDHLHRISREQLPAAASSLTRSFTDDPLIIHLFPAAAARDRLCFRSFTVFAHYAFRRGLAIASSPAMESVGLWIAPGQPALGLWELLRCRVLGLALSAGFGGARRLLDFTDFAGEIHHGCVPGPHWYLVALGTLPERRNRGLGRRLVEPVLEAAGREGLPCFLETNSERNVPFYEALGFEVAEETAIPGTNVGHWAMVK